VHLDQELIMKSRIHKLAAVTGVAAILAVTAGCGDGSSTSSAQTGSSPAAATAAQGGAPDMSALAKKLGVSTAKLQQAMQATRPASGSTPSSPDDMAAALAKQLGLSSAKVKAALQATRPSGSPPQSGAAPSTGQSS